MVNRSKETATLGGGCFWCLEAVLERLRGVERVESGYAGGDLPDPTYREVCSGTTGHAEVVRVHFDPELLPYEELLEVFFTSHDPTTRNRQGPDVGPQYRSIILYESEKQRRTAERVIAELEEAQLWDDPLVTELRPAGAFYRAEGYHQDYYRRNPNQPYCQVVITPKLAELRRKHAGKLDASVPSG